MPVQSTPQSFPFATQWQSMPQQYGVDHTHFFFFFTSVQGVTENEGKRKDWI